jgi:hypothetical protein
MISSKGLWFDTVTGFLNKMSDRISELRLKSKGKNGTVPKYKDKVCVLWDHCTDAKVYEINKGEKKYKVNQSSVTGNYNGLTLWIWKQTLAPVVSGKIQKSHVFIW